jgi:1,4-dihydroxy-2-naphthoyl-CoA hydrolase
MSEAANTIQIQVPFQYCDPAGILFFSRSFELAHQCFEQWVVALGIQWRDIFAHPNLGFPLKHCSADFLRPIRAGQTLDVEISLTNLSATDFELAYVLKSEKKEELARLKTQHVCVDRVQVKRSEIPREIASKLAAVVSKVEVKK